MWFLLVDYSQYFEASTVKIATQARYLHLTSWRTFCTPHGVQRELQCRFRWNGMQNHHRIHIPKSPPGQKLPPLGILIKLNWLFRWDVAQRMLGVPKWNPIPGEVQGFPVSASSQRWRWTHYFSFKVTSVPSVPTAQVEVSRRRLSSLVQGENKPKGSQTQERNKQSALECYKMHILGQLIIVVHLKGFRTQAA